MPDWLPMLPSFDGDRPIVIPMAYARIGDRLYIHGASTTRIVKANGGGVPASRWRSPFSTALSLPGPGFITRRITGVPSCTARRGWWKTPRSKSQPLRRSPIILLPGRWDECREMMPKERKATGVLVLDMEHVSTKVRTGGPVDDQEDLGTDYLGGRDSRCDGTGSAFGRGRCTGGNARTGLRSGGPEEIRLTGR